MATEKRLVWTTDVMSFLCKRCNEMYPDEPCEPCDCLMTEELDKCKTVDAVEVVHARWEPEWMPTGVECTGHAEMTVQALSCSVCGKCVDVSESYFSYCPNCGAKMNGDGNGT